MANTSDCPEPPATPQTPQQPLPTSPDPAAVDPPADAPLPAVPLTEGAAQSAPAANLSPAECAALLRQMFPALFSGPAKPLKLRIQVDIQERAAGRFSKAALSGFFRRHTGSTSYLIAMTKAPHRFDLDGQPSGEITPEHRQVALDELARRRGNQDARRELEEQQRRNRAGLLHDFQTTTLTPANFCALKGVAVEELDGLLELARAEFGERSRQQASTRDGAEPVIKRHAGSGPHEAPRRDDRGRRGR